MKKIRNRRKNKFTYQHTMYACFIGYIVQAIINNFVPLLFLTFQNSYGIPLAKITFLITFNFGLQLCVDLLSAGFFDRMGYRLSVILAHVFSVLGLVLLTVLPDRCNDPFGGIFIAVMVYALGGGLIEVLISPIVEACPTDNKEMAMSLLHSFYCWGHVAVVLLSTLYFHFVGIEHWRYLALLWALVPAVNLLLFLFVPIAPLLEDGEEGMRVGQLFRSGFFWNMMLLMVCAGASEQAVSQWASAFAEKGLQVSKTLGDLMGPMFFAVMMGISRTIFGKYGDKINLRGFMKASAILCIASYLLIAISPYPLLGLVGCGICGFSVGIFWPGTFSLASAGMKGGTAMFAFFALAGDVGCSFGPTLTGQVAAAFGENLKAGILAGIVFPVVLFVGLHFYRKRS